DPTTWIRFRQALERADGHRSPLKRAVLDRGPTPMPVAEAAIPGLNAAQRRAAHAALGSPDLTLVWGPPGTGKTRVLAHVLAALVADGDRPWALADSNAAVDHLALAAVGLGLDVVRIGPVSRVGPALADRRLEARIAASMLGPTLASLDREIVRTWGTQTARRLVTERAAVWDQARDLVLSGADVIATTFGTAARLVEALPTARTAVVDEATQATEPAVWVVVPFVERLVLAGDPAQLGPVVRVPDSPLGVSLLERWVSPATPMLEVQHRMAPELRRLVAGVYGPAYVDAPETATHLPVLELPALWIDTAGAGGEERDPVTRSLFDPLEVRLAALAVAEILARGIAPGDIGVIAPYAAQVAKLREALPAIEVATVNAFQGREKEAIVVTFVRSNPARELGFVADGRRLTVALTRARRQLVLIGDAATLSVHPRFAALLDAVVTVSVWEPPWSDALDG
ncbi:MAG: AAA domain-containing protein, partial [Myxococcota bacterium]